MNLQNVGLLNLQKIEHIMSSIKFFYTKVYDKQTYKQLFNFMTTQNFTRSNNLAYQEDGVTLEIIKRLNIKNGYYVEFCTQNGEECSTRILRENYNWNGLLMDGSCENNNINLKKEFITRENILNFLTN